MCPCKEEEGHSHGPLLQAGGKAYANHLPVFSDTFPSGVNERRSSEPQIRMPPTSSHEDFKRLQELRLNTVKKTKAKKPSMEPTYKASYQDALGLSLTSRLAETLFRANAPFHCRSAHPRHGPKNRAYPLGQRGRPPRTEHAQWRTGAPTQDTCMPIRVTRRRP